jgi:HlyD family type I secretion membrane fusion protein
MAAQPERRLKPVDKLEPFRQGRRSVRIGLVLIVVFFGGFGAWAAIAPLAGAVIVPGTVKIANYRKTVQHLEGGIVKEILVKDGDKVKKGQPLIALDEVRAAATVDVLQVQLDALIARAARLQAERQRLVAVNFPKSLVGRAGDARVAAVLAAENEFFKARRQLVDSQVSLLRAQNKEALDEIRQLDAQMRSADQYLALTKKQLEMNEDLYKKNFVAYTRVIDVQRQMAEKEEKRGEYGANLSQARQRVGDRELRIVSLYEGYAKDASDELKDVESRIADLRERMRPSEDQLKRQSITASIDGTVVGLKVHTIGAVIQPGESVMDIVPTDSPVIAEGKMKVEDIDEVQLGSEVDIQLSAYYRRTTPKVAGKVVYVSADALTDTGPGGPTSYYLLHVEVDRKSLAEIGNLALTPGMPVEMFVRTRVRTMLAYLLEPITDSLRRALREG